MHTCDDGDWLLWRLSLRLSSCWLLLFSINLRIGAFQGYPDPEGLGLGGP